MKKDSTHTGRTTALICGGLATLAALIVRLRTGSPLPVLHLLRSHTGLPPLWLLGILWLGGPFLFGYITGKVWVHPAPGVHRSTWRWRGTLYGLTALALSLLWYPLVFASSLLWLSWLCLLLAAGASLLCTLCWVRILPRTALPLFAWVSQLIFLCGLELVVLFWQ